MAEATRMILKSRAEREECKMLRAIGKAILDSTKDPGTKEEVLRILELKVWVGISRAEGYVRLSLK